MKNLFILLGLTLGFFISTEVIAQEKNIWRTLAMIKFDTQMEGKTDIIQAPRTEPMIKAMDGDEVVVKGYFIPLSGKKAQSHFMFSAYPYASCFFCGNAGPETVMEVFTKDEQKIEYSDNAIYIKGRFKYLGYKPNDIMFALEDAVLVKK